MIDEHNNSTIILEMSSPDTTEGIFNRIDLYKEKVSEFFRLFAASSHFPKMANMAYNFEYANQHQNPSNINTTNQSNNDDTDNTNTNNMNTSNNNVNINSHKYDAPLIGDITLNNNDNDMNSSIVYDDNDPINNNQYFEYVQL